MPKHGPNYSQSPPIVTQEGDQDSSAYEAEKVLNTCFTRNQQGWEYLVKWLGYSDVNNMWVKCLEMTTSTEAIGEYHNNHTHASKPADIKVWLKQHNAHPNKGTS
jgi:hypothetical protein